MATIKIVPKQHLIFTGAKSKAKYSLEPGVAVSIDEADIAHLDDGDYTLGEVKKPEPDKKK